MDIVKRFLNYVSYDTQSDENSQTVPSSLKQLELAKKLKEDLIEEGVSNVILNEYGIVYGEIPSNVDYKTDTIGFIAHMDTSPDSSGKDIKPQIITDYDGKDILLNKDKNIYLSTEEFPFLKDNIHEDLIVTDGTTLLGADDKAGVTAIVELASYLKNHPEVKHGTIKIAFTPDEEVGLGTAHFDVNYFAANYGYTIDGGDIRYIEYECFNAASVKVNIEGKSIHPGSAKGKMINSQLVAMELNQLLPAEEVPEKTEKYEGFHHLCGMEGSCENSTLFYIVRNHDAEILKRQVEDFDKAADLINQKYGRNLVTVNAKYGYRNMKEIILANSKVLEKVENAYKTLGLSYEYEPIRGGTDGAELSYRGMPCPNLGAGGYNFHGPYEYLSITQMKKCVSILIQIVQCN